MMVEIELVDHIRESICKYVEEITADGTPGSLYQPVDYAFAQPGKMFRPLLLALSYSMWYRDDISPVLPQCVAVEFFHNFTLIHDDIMDGADLRRGYQSVFSKYGQNKALLSGDLLLMLSYRMLTAHHDPPVVVALLKAFNKMGIDICEGQQLDMDFEKTGNISTGDYLHMVQKKTGSLISSCLEMGGICAKASEEHIGNLADCGMSLGIGFQIMDDILDLYGDTNRTGKIIGGDILNRKKTLFYIFGCEVGGSGERRWLTNLYNRPPENEQEEIMSILDYFNKYNIKKKVEMEMETQFAKAEEAMNKISVEDERKQPLKQLIYKIKNRSS